MVAVALNALSSCYWGTILVDRYSNIRYNKPPIVEVVCEFRFIPAEPWDLTIPGLVYDRLRRQFPRKQAFKFVESEAVVEEQGVRQEFRMADRMRFLREDEKAFVQIAPDLLSTHHLDPYPTWEGFVPIVREAFEHYNEVARPKGLRRIGLRYINQITIPDRPTKLEDYLNFRPFIGPGLPQNITDFILVIQSPYAEGRDLLRLQLTTAEPVVSDQTNVLIDLDYFLAQPEAVSLEKAFDWIDIAHFHIQESFEASITDLLRELFNA